MNGKQWLVAVGVGVVGVLAAADPKEWKSGIPWAEPKLVTPGDAPGSPPSDAVVLFDGTTMDAWKNGQNWTVEGGVATANKSSVTTKQPFGDIQLHLEFATPAEVNPKQKGQGRGNSGVYLMDGRYEVQILDSFENPTYFDGQCGAIYKQMPPLVNACRKPGAWQTYDIVFTAPRFKADGAVDKPAAVTVLHNGVLVQNHFELYGRTAYEVSPSYKAHAEKLPIQLQYHGNPIRFRNIWVRELVPQQQKAG